jgi:hypothetical protein
MIKQQIISISLIFIFNLSYPYKTEELLFQEVYTDANTKYKVDRR